jgi:hypothetical protein
VVRGVWEVLFSPASHSQIEVIVVVAPSLVQVELIILMISYFLSREAELSPSQSLKAARENKRENNGTRDSCDAAFPRKVQDPYRLAKKHFRQFRCKEAVPPATRTPDFSPDFIIGCLGALGCKDTSCLEARRAFR